MISKREDFCGKISKFYFLVHIVNVVIIHIKEVALTIETIVYPCTHNCSLDTDRRRHIKVRKLIQSSLGTALIMLALIMEA